MSTFNVGTGFGGEELLLYMLGAFDDAVRYGLSQSGETGDVPVHPYGEVLVVLRICATRFSKAAEPGLTGGLIPGYLQSSCIFL